MADIFLSYASQDQLKANNIASKLHDAGFTVWIDDSFNNDSVTSKTYVVEEIQNAICMIVLLSPSAKKARSVNMYIDIARILNKTIFPVLIAGDQQSSVPPQLINSQYIDARQSTDYKLLIMVIRGYLAFIPQPSEIESSKIAKALSQKSPLKIFLSYQRDNQAIIENLVARLGRLGHTVWYDQHLTGGHQWWESILEQIRQCDLFITAVSPTYLDSEACRLEYGYAHDLHKRILPIEIVSVGSYYELPTELQAIQIVKLPLIDDTTEAKLNAVFDKLERPAPMPKRLPTPPKMPVHPLSLLKDQAEAKNLGDSDAQLLLISKIEVYLFSDNAKDQVLAHKLLVNLKKRNDIFHAGGEKITRLLNQFNKD